LRFLRGHGFDYRVAVGTVPLGLQASVSRKAPQKKIACWRPICASLNCDLFIVHSAT
jgi:hypothetical protein